VIAGSCPTMACDPDAGDCNGCDALYVGSSGPFSPYGSNPTLGCTDSNSHYVDNDQMCDGHYFDWGSVGGCAGDDVQEIVCPSYERNSYTAVVDTDCSCSTSFFTPCADVSPYFDLTQPYFTGAS